MRFTQIFKIKHDGVHLKHDAERKPLFGTALGTTDEYGWTSTGITFENAGNTPEHNLAKWVEVMIGYLEWRHIRLNRTDVIALCVFINGMANRQDVDEARRRATKLEDGSTGKREPFIMYLIEALRQTYTETLTDARNE